MNPTLVRRTKHAHRFGRWPNVGFKNPTYADDAAEALLFCKVIFFRMGITALVCLITNLLILPTKQKYPTVSPFEAV